MTALKKIGILVLALVLLAGMAACKKDSEETTAPTVAPTTSPAPATSTAPTSEEVTESQMTEPMDIPVDSLTTYYSLGENNGWINAKYILGEGNVGKQFASFLVTPMIDKVDGSISFADFNKEVTGFSDLSIMVRMNSDGFFDARNGDNFEKLADVAYTADSSYQVEVRADMDAKTYSVFVSDSSGAVTMIAENYAFRTTANDADDMGKVFFVSAAGNDQFTVDSLKRQMLYDAAREHWSKGENFGWQQNGARLDKVYTGKVKIEFDMMDNQTGGNLNGSVDFADSSKDVMGFGDLSMLIRVHFDHGCFDARNGDIFAKEADVLCLQNVVYHIKVEADMDAKTYSYWVTNPEGVTTQIAKDYAFRTTANDADDIGQVFVVSQHANDQLVLRNLHLEQMR